LLSTAAGLGVEGALRGVFHAGLRAGRPFEEPIILRLAIYEWDAWHQFMLVRAVPEACRLTARIGESADEILGRLPTGISAFAFHLNITTTAAIPPDRQTLIHELHARRIVPLNGAVTDISKTGVQTQCRALGLPTATADFQGDGSELVIVKTDLNFGGKGERQLPPTQRRNIGSPAVSDVMSDWAAYQVLRREQVPGSWWNDPTLVIERFIDNRAHHLYRVNFAGDRIVILRLTNPHPIKKIMNSTARLDVYCGTQDLRSGAVAGIEPSVAAVIVGYLDGSGMDFGALEIIPDDSGRAYIIDVNSTCYAKVLNVRILTHLRRGLFARIATRAAQLGGLAARWPALPLPTWPMVRADVMRIANQIIARRAQRESRT
jgi:hypothetical protein